MLNLQFRTALIYNAI